MTIDIKNEIKKLNEIQLDSIVSINFISFISYIEMIYLRFILKSVLKKQKNGLIKLKKYITLLEVAPKEDVLILMEAKRNFLSQIEKSNLLIERKNITGRNKLEKLILENNQLTKECSELLSAKLYMSKPSEISEEEWKNYAKDIKEWAGDDWDDPIYDVYDADYAPILNK